MALINRTNKVLDNINMIIFSVRTLSGKIGKTTKKLPAQAGDLNLMMDNKEHFKNDNVPGGCPGIAIVARVELAELYFSII